MEHQTWVTVAEHNSSSYGYVVTETTRDYGYLYGTTVWGPYSFYLEKNYYSTGQNYYVGWHIWPNQQNHPFGIWGRAALTDPQGSVLWGTLVQCQNWVWWG
jgi:hypothetical protein